MEFKIIITIPLGIALLYYGLFKLKTEDNLYPKILVISIAVLSELTSISKLLLSETIFYPFIIFGSIIAMFGVMTVLMWKDRKNLEKKNYVIAYFSAMGFFSLFLIVVLILAKAGFFG